MEMSDEFKLEIVNRAAKMLQSAGVGYAIVHGDRKIGNLEVRARKGRQRNHKYDHGERRDHYKKYLDQLQNPGDYVAVPLDKYEPEELRKGMCAILFSTFGSGGYTTSVNKKQRTIEVMLT
jgi:hypothetical protein